MTGMKEHRQNFILPALIAMAMVIGAFTVLVAPAFADTKAGLPEEVLDNGIPVLSIDIDPEEYQKIIESEEHAYRSYSGSISITVPKGYTGEYSETPLPSQENLELEYLRGRGNSTWTFAKKPFKFKLKNSTDLLGMGANKHWVLLANAYDGTMVRNRIVGYMGRMLGMDFTPMYTPVDLVVNGEYRGSYTLAHQVRIGKARVNIKELKPADIAEPEVTGGYLLQLSPYGDEGELNIFETGKGVSFTTNNPVFESEDEDETLGAPEQRKYISSYLQQVEDAIHGEGFRDENGVPYTDLMDAHSAAAYWLVQVFSYNTDAFGTPSTYLYKDRGGKLCWGPLWDFDLTFDPVNLENGFGELRMEWLDYLRAYDPEFQKELRQIWTEYDAVITEIVREGGLLDQYAAELKNSWEDNAALAEAENWKEGSAFDVNFGTQEEEIDKVREFLTARQAWFRENIDTEELTDVFCELTFIADGEVIETVHVYRGEGLRKDRTPDLSSLEKDDYIAVGWNDEDGNPVGEDESIMGDRTFTARYVHKAEAIPAERLYFEQKNYWLELEGDQYIGVPHTITPENAEEIRITWRTSDPEVVMVDEAGVLEIKGPGDATITGRLNNGAEASYQVHIRNSADIPKDEATALQADQETLTLRPGEYGQVQITPVPSASNVFLYYESSDAEVAEEYEGGVIKAIAPGICTIEVTDIVSKKTVTFTVVVEDDSEEVAGLKTQLSEQVKAASRDLATGKYTSDTVKALKKRMAEANAVIDDRKATVRDINIAQLRLLRAWRLLEPVDQAAEDADRILHEEIDALAKELIEVYDSVEPAVYTASSYGKLAEALAKAEQVLADEASTAQQVRAAKTELLKARQALQKKSANTLTAKGKSVKLKAKKLKKKTLKVKASKAVKVSSPCGTVKYTLAGVSKAKFKKYFKVDPKSGGLTVKKGLKKGAYTVKIKVSASGDDNHLPAAKIASVKVKVK